MKRWYAEIKKEISSFFERRRWPFWIMIVAVAIFLGWLLINYLGIDWLKDSKEITSILKEGIHESITKSEEIEKSAVAEYQSFLSILSLLISVVVAWVAYKQLPSIAQQSERQANQAEAEFLAHIDERWCSKEITAVREELWTIYAKAQKKNQVQKIGEKAIKEKSIETVQNYILKIDQDAQKSPNKKIMSELFKILNFLELLGMISILSENGIINKKALKIIFGSRLEYYVSFYLKYFNNHPDYPTNAKKLLVKMKE